MLSDLFTGSAVFVIMKLGLTETSQYTKFFLLLEERQFIDWKKIILKAGDGGDGCVHFRRKKYRMI